MKKTLLGVLIWTCWTLFILITFALVGGKVVRLAHNNLSEQLVTDLIAGPSFIFSIGFSTLLAVFGKLPGTKILNFSRSTTKVILLSLLVIEVVLVADWVKTKPAFLPPDHVQNHIQIEREILLEQGNKITPTSIAKTKKGEFIIVGRVNRNTERETRSSAWATKVDGNGNVIWRHETEIDTDGTHRIYYSGAVALADDTSIICGTDTSSTVGLITHISKTGEVISQQRIIPKGGKKYESVEIQDCASWGNTIILKGGVWPVDTPKDQIIDRMLTWLVKLDSSGNFISEKIMRPISTNMPHEMILMPNHDLVLAVDASYPATDQNRAGQGGTQVTRLNENFEIKKQFAWPSDGNTVIARPTGNDDVLHLLNIKIDDSNTVVSNSLDEWEFVSRSHTGSTEKIYPETAYQLSDGSFALFGSQRHTGGYAAIAWMNGHFSQLQSFEFASFGFSPSVYDAIPTGNQNEFAIVRSTEFMQRQSESENDRSQRMASETGVVLSFVKFTGCNSYLFSCT